MTMVISPSTDEVYNAIPQSIQDSDSSNGSPLRNLIYGMVEEIDSINALMLDDVGAGITVHPVDLYAEKVTLAYLALPIDSIVTTFTIFGTDATWNQIDTTVPFVLQIENEQILVPAGVYNWTAPNVTFPI